MKRCTKCGTLKPLEEFDIKADRGRPAARCKPCRRADQNERNRRLHPPKLRPVRIAGTTQLLTCTRCGQPKPADAFPPRKRGGTELQSWCRECFAEVAARHYAENRERERRRIYGNLGQLRSQNQRLLAEYLASHPCVDCGETDIVVLEFDHIAGKRGNVRVLATSRTWNVVADEIAKCQVRCGNCHRRKTAREQGRWILAC